MIRLFILSTVGLTILAIGGYVALAPLSQPVAANNLLTVVPGLLALLTVTSRRTRRHGGGGMTDRRKRTGATRFVHASRERERTRMAEGNIY